MEGWPLPAAGAQWLLWCREHCGHRGFAHARKNQAPGPAGWTQAREGHQRNLVPNQMLSETHCLPGGENVNSLKVAGRRGDRRPWAAQAWVVSLLLVARGSSMPPAAGLGHDPHAQRGVASGHSRRQEGRSRGPVVLGDQLSSVSPSSVTTACPKVTHQQPPRTNRAPCFTGQGMPCF